MRGLLKKLNSSNVWKDRYGQLSDTHFVTYKPKNGKPTAEVKESINLRLAQNVLIVDAKLKIILENDQELVFKGAKIEEWYKTIQERLKWIRDNEDNLKIHKCGVLSKKSHNKYQGFQVRLIWTCYCQD